VKAPGAGLRNVRIDRSRLLILAFVHGDRRLIPDQLDVRG
jgi:hypothetical protein